ncbi:Uncharacterised protein [Moraxella caprae]|uniref:Uncharacterized protein n=1 Tax=Moraxella caprae TaxID=90240 RepID=A0A378QZL0_9GAMM|nr:Uncharacterised protein [Moraxella caprae]
MQMWHDKGEFASSDHTKQENKILNFYNTTKLHLSLSQKDEITGKTLTFTLYEWLEIYLVVV